jgi:hypothetical protein
MRSWAAIRGSGEAEVCSDIREDLQISSYSKEELVRKKAG